jgi:hypothetical protein
VLLGGHGRSTDAWIGTTADDWAAPIKDEHERLSELGYRDINFALSLAAGPMFTRLLMQGELDELTPPANVAFLSPQIIMGNKLLYAAPVVGPVLNNVPGNLSEEESRLWYTNRPQQVMNELATLLVETEQALDRGDVVLPEGTRAHIWVADGDPVNDHTGFDKLQHNLIADDTVGRTTVNSELQTFWRSVGRPLVEEEGQHTWTEQDQLRAEISWEDFYDFLTGGA